MKDFTGRTAFVTGGANGIGIGLVRALLAQGCNVAIADIRSESIEAALKSLGDQRAMGVQVDGPNALSVDNDFPSPRRFLRQCCGARQTAPDRRKPGQRAGSLTEHFSPV